MSPLRRFVFAGPELMLAALLTSAAQAGSFSKPDIHGNARLRYSLNEVQGMESHEGTLFLSLDGRNVLWEKLGFSLDARDRLHYEKSGPVVKSRESFSAYLANVSLNDLYGGVSLKAGRQYYYGGETTAHFDGGAAELQPLRWLKIAAYGGKPVAMMGLSLADQYRGGGLKLGAGSKGYVQLDALLASHHRRYATDREAQLTIFRRLIEGLDFTGNLTYLNRLPKSGSARMRYYVSAWGLTLMPNYYRHLYVADPASDQLSPYQRSMAYTERFERVGLGASKYFNIGLSLSGGANYRMPSRRKDGYLSAAVPHLFLHGLEVVVSGNYDTQAARRAYVISTSAAYPLLESLRVSGGSSYGRTRDEDYGGLGNMTSRTYFSVVKWTFRRGLDVTFSPSMVKSGDNSPMYRFELTNNWRF